MQAFGDERDRIRNPKGIKRRVNYRKYAYACGVKGNVSH